MKSIKRKIFTNILRTGISNFCMWSWGTMLRGKRKTTTTTKLYLFQRQSQCIGMSLDSETKWSLSLEALWGHTEQCSFTLKEQWKDYHWFFWEVWWPGVHFKKVTLENSLYVLHWYCTGRDIFLLIWFLLVSYHMFSD